MKRYSMQVIPSHHSRGQGINPVEISDGDWVLATDAATLAARLAGAERLLEPLAKAFKASQEITPPLNANHSVVVSLSDCEKAAEFLSHR